jgi:hypothetical protein
MPQIKEPDRTLWPTRIYPLLACGRERRRGVQRDSVDPCGDAGVNGILFGDRTEPWKQGWIDINLGRQESSNGREAMNESEMHAELERLRAENAQLKNKDKGGLSLKVSEKGAVSLYGMGRFPVTLYKEQWLRVLASAPEIEAFIRENDSRLKTKE